jgi:hypothetical protein
LGQAFNQDYFKFHVLFVIVAGVTGCPYAGWRSYGCAHARGINAQRGRVSAIMIETPRRQTASTKSRDSSRDRETLFQRDLRNERRMSRKPKFPE